MADRWIKGEALTASKLNNTVDDLNSINRASPSGVQDGVPRFSRQCFIRITEATPVTGLSLIFKQWTYKCQILRFTNHLGYTFDLDSAEPSTGLVVDTSLSTPTAGNVVAYNIYEDDGSAQFQVPTGTRCRGNIFFHGQSMVVWFWYQNNSSPFAVQLRKVSGVAGDETTSCTWAYDCLAIRNDHYSLDEVLIAEAIIPSFPRFANTTYTEAPEYSIGLGCWNKDGIFKLLIAFEEAPQSQACT